jgi:hypothetical protein
VSDWVIRLPIEDPEEHVQRLFRARGTNNLIRLAMRSYESWDDCVEATLADNDDAIAITAGLIGRGLDAQRVAEPPAHILAAATAGKYVLYEGEDPQPENLSSPDEARFDAARRCWICGDRSEHVYLDRDSLRYRVIKGENPIQTRIAGRVCESCRAEHVGFKRPSLAGDGESPDRSPDHGPQGESLDCVPSMMRMPHRCDLCHVGYDSPRKLGAHRASKLHLHLAKVSYHLRAGYMVVRGSVAEQMRDALDLTPHPGPLGVAWTAEQTLGDDVWAAVPVPVWDAIVGAMTTVVYRDQIRGHYMTLDGKRLRRTRVDQVYPTWGRMSVERATLLHNAHLALTIAVTVKQALPEAPITWPRLAWGMGEIEVESRYKQGTPVSRMDEVKQEQGRARAAAQAIRREVGKLLGPVFMGIVHEIWGVAPPGERARSTARLSQME